MKHQATPRFWKCYQGLPKEVRELADRCYALLKENPAHPSLHFKRVGQFWSARVGLHYRAVAVEAGAADLLLPVVLRRPSAAGERSVGRVVPSRRSSFPDLVPVIDTAPHKPLQPTSDGAIEVE